MVHRRLERTGLKVPRSAWGRRPSPGIAMSPPRFRFSTAPSRTGWVLLDTTDVYPIPRAQDRRPDRGAPRCPRPPLVDLAATVGLELTAASRRVVEVTWSR